MQKRTNVTIECEASDDLLVTKHGTYQSVSLHTNTVDGGSLNINANHIPQLIDALTALISWQNPDQRQVSLKNLKAQLETRLNVEVKAS